MSRCIRFFDSPRRKEGAYPQRSVTDQQRRRGGKAAQPRGRERCGLSGGVAYSSQVAADMLLARALPSRPPRFRATWLSFSTVSLMKCRILMALLLTSAFNASLAQTANPGQTTSPAFVQNAPT